MRNTSIAALAAVMMVAGCGEQTPAEQARDRIENLLDEVDGGIEDVNEMYRDRLDELNAEMTATQEPCGPRRIRRGEDEAAYLDEMMPCFRYAMLSEAVTAMDTLVQATNPNRVRQNIAADRVRVEQMTDSELLEMLPRVRQAYGQIQPETVEVWYDGFDTGSTPTSNRSSGRSRTATSRRRPCGRCTTSGRDSAARTEPTSGACSRLPAAAPPFSRTVRETRTVKEPTAVVRIALAESRPAIGRRIEMRPSTTAGT